MATLLSPVVFGSLYKDTIVLIEEKMEFAEKIAKNEEKSSQKNGYLGENKKKIIFILNTKTKTIPDGQQKTLHKLLAACNLEIQDVAIINYSEFSITYQQLKESLNAKIVLLFGLNTREIGLPFTIPDYQIQAFDGCRYMQAQPETLKSGNISPETKKAKQHLWLKLKELFINNV